MTTSPGNRALNLFAGRKAAALVLAAILPSFADHSQGAEPPRLLFDTGQAVACRIVDGEEAPPARPGEKTIEAAFRVSILRRDAGDGASLEQVLIEVVSTERRLRVMGFSPQTELIAEHEGAISLEETTTRTRSLDAGVHGSAGVPSGTLDIQVRPNVGGGLSRAETVKESSQRLAPKIPAVTAGTTNNLHGAFFKLVPTSQSTLEGERVLRCRFAVPEDWRADWAVVRCLATCRRDELFGDKVATCGRATFLVGLYLEEDAEAKAAADALAQLAAPAAARPAPGTLVAPAQEEPSAGPVRALGGALRQAGRWLCAKPVAGADPAGLEAALARLAALSGTR